MKHNAFQQAEDIEFTGAVNELIHSAIESRASSLAGYLIDNGLDYEGAVSIQHGIENIDVLFPQSTLQKVSKFTTLPLVTLKNYGYVR